MIKSLDFGSVKMKHLALHKVGNKIQEEDLELSDFELEVEENTPLHKSLMAYFLKPFKEGGYYHFTDEESEDLNLNQMFGFSRRLFADPFEQFMTQSREIAKHLYNESTHPSIKGGELYVAYLEDCIVDGEVVNAIGLFKTEKKDKFLKVKDDKGQWALVQDEGANVKKLDKGCLIFNFEEEKGYKICLKDSPSKNVEAQYWKESFLRLKKREDSFFHTQNYLNICKDFVIDVFNEENNVDRPQQMDMLNRSMQFFTENEQFNIVEFENAVMEEPEVIDAFQNFKEEYKEKYEIPVYDEFFINPTAVKKSRKDFKSIIKLDKKIQINVAGNEDHIEKGFDDERGMNYYIVYYNEEE